MHLFSLLICALAVDLQPVQIEVIGGVRDAWRRPVHVDAVESAIVHNTLDDLDWMPVTSDESGAFDIPEDGWARVIFDGPEEASAVLSVGAVGDVWINGLPRGGDIYGYGTLRLPFQMSEGPNEVLLRRGRGRPTPIVNVGSAIEMSPSDITMPDALLHEPVDDWAGVLVHNVRSVSLRDATITATMAGRATRTPIPDIGPHAFMKVPVHIEGPAAADEADRPVHLVLTSSTGQTLATLDVKMRTRTRDQVYRRTFRSGIDGSVQYYAMREAVSGSDEPGIVLSLHGASVEATGQARCFANRDWCHIVAPTNRRPFGFDWEEWGRIDALEALADASGRYPNDPDQVWLTGHSMGGHGTWNVGLTVPDRWAAIAPSAGWATFWSYTGPDRYEEDGGVRGVLHRAANPSDTMLVLPNAERFGVYVLHGDADTVVPVSEARAMRAALADFHGDFAYYEEPGAGHWWGDRCMDFPALMDFLRQRSLGEGGHRDKMRFVTVDPGGSSTCDWVGILQQDRSLEPSSVDLQVIRDDEGVLVRGTTENIVALSIDPAHRDIDAGDVIRLELDGAEVVESPTGQGLVHVHRDSRGSWHLSAPPIAADKNPGRSGRLRSAWNNDVMLVHGTQGTPEENAWSLARARQDAERWWYRGNGMAEVVADHAFDPDKEPDRGVIIYGNRDVNSAWAMLLADAPIQVNRVAVITGDRTVRGDDLAALLVRPRPGSDVASVAAVAGTGAAGRRLTATFPLFLAGVGWPDWFIARADVLEQGEDAIVGAGFFGNDWTIDPSQSAWR